MWQVSYPPANGASQGNYFLPKSHKTALAAKVESFFLMVFGQRSNFSPEIIGVKFGNRQTEKFCDTNIRGYVDFFFQLNLLPPYSLCPQWDKFFDTIYGDMWIFSFS